MPERTPEERLEALGIVLPKASEPAGKYANFVQVNGLLFMSGKGPSGNPKGKLGRDYTTEEGYDFARQVGLQIIAVLKAELGSLSKVKRVVKIQGFINADPAFEEHPKVLNGCSEILLDVFGEKVGLHARSVFGAASVRGNLPIIVDSIFEVIE